MSKDKKTLIENITAKVVSIFADEPKADAKEEKKEKLMVEAVVKDTGITVSADAWEVGNAVTTVTEEGDTIAIPEGSYELENGAVLTVDADGVITEIVEVETEVEVEAEKKEEDMAAEKKEPVYITETELAAAMEPVIKALEKVAVKMSAMEPKKAEEKDVDKLQAENKLFKQRLSEKRKSIKLQKEKSEKTVSREGKVTNRGHVNGVRQRVMKNFEDFDFTIQKSNEPIDLN